jgi:hypothetical protein
MKRPSVFLLSSFSCPKPITVSVALSYFFFAVSQIKHNCPMQLAGEREKGPKKDDSKNCGPLLGIPFTSSCLKGSYLLSTFSHVDMKGRR